VKKIDGGASSLALIARRYRAWRASPRVAPRIAAAHALLRAALCLSRTRAHQRHTAGNTGFGSDVRWHAANCSRAARAALRTSHAAAAGVANIALTDADAKPGWRLYLYLCVLGASAAYGGCRCWPHIKTAACCGARRSFAVISANASGRWRRRRWRVAGWDIGRKWRKRAAKRKHGEM